MDGRTFTWTGVAVGGILAGLALPKLLRTSRLAAKTVGGMTFTSGMASGPPPRADPREGRPA